MYYLPQNPIAIPQKEVVSREVSPLFHRRGELRHSITSPVNNERLD